jgi:hypothetical protein
MRRPLWHHEGLGTTARSIRQVIPSRSCFYFPFPAGKWQSRNTAEPGSQPLRTKCGLRRWLIAVMKPQPSLATMVDGAPGFRYHNTPSRTLAVFLGLSPASRMTSGTSMGCSTSGGCSRDQVCDAARPAPQLWDPSARALNAAMHSGGCCVALRPR